MKKRIQRKQRTLRERLVKKVKAFRRHWSDFLNTAPSVWAILTAYLPVRVWNIGHTDLGSGPYATSIKEAADYVEADSQEYEDGHGKITSVVFSDREKRRLRWPGVHVKKSGWIIRCGLMPKYMVSLYEWEGW